MKPIRFLILICSVAFCFCISALGQPTHKTVVVSIDGLDYGEGIGVVNGTYTYHFMYKLNSDGFIESVHWNVRDFNLYNQNGEKVKVIDSGLDTYGVLWDFWNTPSKTNADLGYPEITYNVSDYWLDPIMPPQMPQEGVFVNMSAKMQVKNVKVKFGMMWIVKFNANGDPIVDFIKFH